MTVTGVHRVEATEPCYLLEIRLDHPNYEYDWSGVTQEEPGQPRSNWQVPYDEQPLDDSGTRWVFFFHYLDCCKPLLTPNGTVALPELSLMPEHLIKIEYDEP